MRGSSRLLEDAAGFAETLARYGWPSPSSATSGYATARHPLEHERLGQSRFCRHRDWAADAATTNPEHRIAARDAEAQAELPGAAFAAEQKAAGDVGLGLLVESTPSATCQLPRRIAAPSSAYAVVESLHIVQRTRRKPARTAMPTR